MVVSDRTALEVFEREFGKKSVVKAIHAEQAEVKVSVGPFVPKAWTPFQWEPFVPVAEMRRRIELLRARFRRIRWSKLTWNEPEESALEALLSRGDRRFGAVIARAHLRRLAAMPAWSHAQAAIGDAVAGILEWRVEGDDLFVTANARQSDGPTPGARTILAALGIPDEQIPLVPVLREAMLLAGRPAIAFA